MKNMVNYEVERNKSKQIVSNISNLLKQTEWKISELDKSKKQTDSIIQKFDISCYRYNLVEEMSNSKNRAEKNIRALIDKLNNLIINFKESPEKSIKKINYINDLLESSEIQLKSIGKEQINDINSMQLNSIKKGIYNKYMLLKSEIDRDIIKEKFDKMQNRSRLKRWFDRFFDVEDEVERRRETLFMQIQEIDKTREALMQNTPPTREYKIIDILADIEVFFMDSNVPYSKYKEKLHEIKDIKNKINETFAIDSKELKKVVVEKRQSRLPAKVNNKLNKLIKEREKAIAFLNKNGYITPDEEVKCITKSNMKNIIQRIDSISDRLERALKA